MGFGGFRGVFGCFWFLWEMLLFGGFWVFSVFCGFKLCYCGPFLAILGCFLGTFGYLGILVGSGVFRLDCDLGLWFSLCVCLGWLDLGCVFMLCFLRVCELCVGFRAFCVWVTGFVWLLVCL